MVNKIIVVTGSTSGIGLGIAKNLAKDNIIITNGIPTTNNTDHIKSSIEQLGAKEHLHLVADMANPDQVNKMFENILNKFSKIDVLVNNAGIQYVSPIENFPAEKWESIIRINLISAFYTIKHSIPSMKKNKWGRIINIASAHGLVASPYKSAYIAAKHGIIGLTKTVALETAEDNITVNAICPGYVRTPLVDGQVADTAKTRKMTEEDVVKNIILGAQATKKFVEINEIAELVSYLVSKKAQSITGSSYSIDGGWTAH